MTRYFCTYFDKNYLLRGLTFYNSLRAHCPDFTLWILAFDDESFDLLQKMNLENVRLVKLSDFEDQKLVEVKDHRKTYEYYWTCTPSLPLFILKNNPELDMITYMDSDILFYSSPEPIFEEFGVNSIMIIPHRFSDDQKHKIKTKAIYNVGMLIFRNNANGLQCLNWWRDKCIDWCFDRFEDGKFGDQLYLNDWVVRFKGVCVLHDHGANVASWNIDRYSFHKESAEILGKDIESGKYFQLIFYHFHGLKMYISRKGIQFYPIQVLDRQIYEIYRNALIKSQKKIFKIDPNWNYGFVKKPDILRIIKQIIIKSLS